MDQETFEAQLAAQRADFEEHLKTVDAHCHDLESRLARANLDKEAAETALQAEKDARAAEKETLEKDKQLLAYRLKRATIAAAPTDE